MDPYTIAALLLLGLTVAWFWPRHGIAARRRRYRELARRETFEHTLKHLHHCEYMNFDVRLDGLAGVLGISRDHVVGVLRDLERAGLVDLSQGTARLTPSGRSEALRVIRVHRLWEKFFAERSGLDETLWHEEADRREHFTSSEQMERLAANLGYPRFDPHGAPIPTPSGDLPSTRGMPLADFEVGQVGRVVHIEDEPAALNEQLVAQGLALGAVFRVLDRDPAGLHLEVDGQEQIVAQVAAGNVSAEQVERPTPRATPGQRLSRIKLNRKARVVGLLPSCRGIQRRRLLDLGLVPGTIVAPELRSTAGTPVAYRVRGALVALRTDQADQIEVEPVNAEG